MPEFFRRSRNLFLCLSSTISEESLVSAADLDEESWERPTSDLDEESWERPTSDSAEENPSSFNNTYNWDHFFRLITDTYTTNVIYPPIKLINSLLVIIEDGDTQLKPYEETLTSLKDEYDNRKFLKILRIIPSFIKDKSYAEEFAFYLKPLCTDLNRMALESSSIAGDTIYCLPKYR